MYVWIVSSPRLHPLAIFKMEKPTHVEVEAEYGHRILDEYEVSGPYDVWVSQTLENIDFTLLRRQKESLLTAINYMDKNSELSEDLEGILGLIDSIQDEMAKYLGEERIFGPSSDNNPKSNSVKLKRPSRKLNIQH